MHKHPSNTLFYLFLEAGQLAQQYRTSVLTTLGVTSAEDLALHILSETPISLADFADSLQLHPSSAYNLAITLNDKALAFIYNTADEISLSLSPTGSELKQKLNETWTSASNVLADNLGKKQRKKLRRALKSSISLLADD